jgi:hypothetical protein
MAGVAEFPQKRHFVASNSADELVDRPTSARSLSPARRNFRRSRKLK